MNFEKKFNNNIWKKHFTLVLTNLKFNNLMFQIKYIGEKNVIDIKIKLSNRKSNYERCWIEKKQLDKMLIYDEIKFDNNCINATKENIKSYKSHLAIMTKQNYNIYYDDIINSFQKY
jgi:hypothetical protein